MKPSAFREESKISGTTLQKMERDLDHVRKRLSYKEIRESAGFAENGIQEALNYLAIVKKVIEKTQRVLSKKALG